MPDALIVSAARTPIGRARKGSLARVDAFELAEVAVGAAIERAGFPAAAIDDLVLAESYQGGGVIGRNVAVRLGMPGVPAQATNRHCASGLTALATAAASIRAGMDRVVVAGGTESMSTQPMTTKPGPDGTPAWWMSEPNPSTPQAPAFDMPLTVGENTARHAGLTRTDVDEWAVYSHARAVATQDAGGFAAEIVPVEHAGGRFDTDEHPRRGTTLEVLAALPVLKPDLDHPTVTAGNAAGLNDAAAAVAITASDFATAHGLEPLARIRSWAAVGVPPELTGTAPSTAIPKALERAGLTLEDVDLFEINEAFCSVPVAAVRALGLDATRVNVNGSGASLGHPIAATGARMVVTMIHELRRRGASVGVVSMCAGGGMGSAMVLEIA
ncbi:thiolase family protein [Nocardioides sp. YIM 152588]|uniref:thiolase family protein n=1 Tax=Nocardioides sp. YIM 152588 TaxID=3158259 RepID=UPI0032E43127